MIRVLMVEDDSVQVELTRAQCARQKLLFELDSVTSAEAALAFLRAEGAYRKRACPDLLLVDLNLPGMSGSELLLLLMQDPVLSAIPVVVLTAIEPPRSVQAELQKHACAWVEKPLDLSAWGKIVKAVPGLGLSLIKLPVTPSAS
jgi:two-component system response regulator